MTIVTQKHTLNFFTEPQNNILILSEDIAYGQLHPIFKNLIGIEVKASV